MRAGLAGGVGLGEPECAHKTWPGMESHCGNDNSSLALDCDQHIGSLSIRQPP
jgi:hypothetical protein